MPKAVFLVFTLALATLVAGSAFGQSPEAVLDRVEQAIHAEAAAQEQANAWAQERDQISAEIRNLKLQEAWLDFQVAKYQRYIEGQNQAIAELERRKEEAARLSMELEPFLETVVDQLEAHVARDLPFLPEERAARIAFLRQSLDDYHLDLGEKLRRVLEALQVEMEYGRTVETGFREIMLDGVPVRVSTFRLGRTALYYLIEDGSAAGMWDRETGDWQALDTDFARTLMLARDMAARKRAVELLPLPLPLPELLENALAAGEGQ